MARGEGVGPCEERGDPLAGGRKEVVQEGEAVREVAPQVLLARHLRQPRLQLLHPPVPTPATLPHFTIAGLDGLWNSGRARRVCRGGRPG